MKKTAAIAFGLTLLAVVSTNRASGQVTLTGTDYTQRFDNISAGLPPGWSVRTNATATSLGIEVTLTTNSTSWGNTGGQFANYASTVNNSTNLLGSESPAIQTACTNRGPGVRQTSTFGDPGAAFVLQLQNTLGFGNIQLSIDLNMLSVQTRSNFWKIDYGIGSNPGSFISVWTNGDPGVFGSAPRTVSFNNALDNQAQSVWIRVVTLEVTTGGGTRDTFGIDNFKLTYESSGALSPVPLQIEQIGTNAVLTWTNSSFALEAAPVITGVYTSVPGATSPYTNAIVDPEKYFRLKAN